jgi:hypothetical protein
MAFNGVITNSLEIDVYRVHLVPSVEYWAVASGGASERGVQAGLTLPDPFVGVLDAETQAIVAADDNSAEPDAITLFTVPAEKDYYLAVGDITGGTGSYETGVIERESGDHVAGELFTEFLVDPVTGMVEEKNTGPTDLPGQDLTQFDPGQFESGTLGVQGSGYSPPTDYFFV